MSLAIPAFAEDITFESSVNSNNVSMGTAVNLTLTVRGEQNVDVPQLGAIDGFDTRYTGPATQVSVINGAYSSSKSFNYLLLPLKEGKFTIPSFELTLKGQVYRTRPIIVDVVGSGQSPSTSDGQTTEAKDLSDKIKLSVLIPRNECFVNETLPVVIKLYYQDVPLQDITMPELKTDGITVGDYAQPRQYEETHNGVKYRVVEFQTNLSASRAGQISVGPVSLNANLLYKVEGGKSPFGGRFFDDDFFSGFFSSYQKKPLTVTSGSFGLTVKPLPEDGKPADFSGAVGQFDLQVEVGPAEVKAGDPVTLKAAVSGAGNLKIIRMPQIAFEGFKVYEPEIKEEGGRKVLEQVLIPTKADIASVPAVSFCYFDPVRGQYATVTRGPFPVKVTAPAPGEEFQAVAYANAKASPLNENLGKDIIFIKDQIGTVRDARSSLSRELPFWAVLVVFLNIWGIFFGIYVYHKRLKTDTAFARRQRAPKAAREAWAFADSAAASGNTKAFYDALEQGLRAFLSDAFSLPPGDASGLTLYEKMDRENVPDEIVKKLKALEERIELARYASQAVTPEEMSRHLDEAKAVTRRVEDFI